MEIKLLLSALAFFIALSVLTGFVTIRTCKFLLNETKEN